MNYLALFFSGAFLCNALPHLCCGVRGEAFPTPFAKPHGVGLSSPLVNFYWGMANLVAGGGLLLRGGLPWNANPGWLAVLAGALLTGTYAAWHFGKVRAHGHTQ